MDEVNSEELVKSLEFCVIDLETTGGNPKSDQIIEIGLVQIKNKEITKSKNFLINPEMTIPDFIQKLTSIKQDDIKDCPTIQEIIDEVLSFIGDRILVAHNTSFDIPFLNGILKKLGKKELQNKVLCTNVMTKYLIPEIMNSNLNYMSQLFNIEHVKAHRAIEDAKATAILLLKYLDIFIEKKIRKINQLYYPRNKFELDRIHIDRTHSNQFILDLLKKTKAPIVMTFKGEQGTLLCTLPLEEVSEDLEYVKEMLNFVDWKIITIKLVGPYFEALLQLNTHFNKFPEENREKVLDYLHKKFEVDSINYDKNILNKVDFLVAPHLIANQLTVYSFLNLSSKNQLIFKFPGHKKKFQQYIKNQITRFEKNAKGKKRNQILKPLIPFFSTYVSRISSSDNYLFIERSSFKSSLQEETTKIEEFVLKKSNLFQFPTSHL